MYLKLQKCYETQALRLLSLKEPCFSDFSFASLAFSCEN